MSLPALTAEQRQDAARAAVEARLRRAEVKQAVSEGRMSIGEVLAVARTDEAVAKLRVTTLLECLPGIGPVRAGRLVDELGIAPSRRLRGLGVHQSERLARRCAEGVR
ncbi:hypothetical protein SAMN05445756_0035 [Kytococcus aerolatus]|uniref:Integration host factor-like helix-two turn-helix domain-containing protein n=1 Tax=Kytococcus aerolatus TaxID=592308 RepID=A0A212SZV7_9MICO|nr:integration host factor, actinobacterial type [Kytococcus aerolatus]SNC59289.1 hypothetical protein SAMN05445756_0035 [Kytococcus aerolatus]